MKHPSLSIDFCGITFENPFCLSSSPVDNCYDMCAKALRSGWAGVVYKTLHLDSFVVNEVSPRFDQLQKEATPFVGFKNMEQIAEHHLDEDLAALRRLKQEFPTKIIIASIMASNEDDWKEIAQKVSEAGADMIEMNLSCPQMTSHAMGSDVGQNPELCEVYTRAVTSATSLPVIGKMTPNITDMTVPAKACLAGGAAAISAINTIKSITNVDLNKKVGRPIVDGKSAISGYSGKAVKPVGLRFIQQLRDDPELAHVPLSGIGGIETWIDAAEYILLGASNLQVTTAVMQYGYRIVEDMKDGLSHYMLSQGVHNLKDLVGLAHNNIIPAEDLNRTYKVYPMIDEDACVGCGRCVISCYDGAHQAMKWNQDTRRPTCDHEKCVGCQLCKLVCPAQCISLGEVEMKPGEVGDPQKIAL